MKLTIISSKVCWRDHSSDTGYATDGGFPFHMESISGIFKKSFLIVPVIKTAKKQGAMPLNGKNITVIPIQKPWFRGGLRKFFFPLWLLTNYPKILHYILKNDAVHTPIPSDVGTVGMLTAKLFNKKLFVRHCGNWARPKTKAEKFWRYFMEKYAGGKNVFLATGGGASPPTTKNKNIDWIFSTSLTGEDIQANFSKRTFNPKVKLNLIIVCRQQIEKGTDIVIKAFELLKENYPHAELHVIGDGIDLPKLQTLSNNTKVTSSIYFHGKLSHDEVIQQMKYADIFCYPTNASEGFPKVVLEALSCGLPVITTNISVLPDLIEKNQCGLILKDRNPNNLYNAIQKNINDPNLYDTFSKNAFNTAKSFTLEAWQNVIKKKLISQWGKV